MKLFKYLLILSICFSYSIINAQNPTLTNSMEKKKVDKVFQVVEDAPIFPGCEQVTKIAERKRCANHELFEFLQEYLVYPKEALEKDIEGAVIVQFIVEKDGRLTNINVIRGIGYGCNEEAIRLIEIMPDWNPGRQRGQPARVQFTLPIRFILE